MIIGTIDSGKTLTTLECNCKHEHMAGMYCPGVSHQSIYRNRIPTVTEVVGVLDICPRKVWYDYHVPVYMDVKNLYTLNRGQMQHEAMFKTIGMKEFLLFDQVGSVLWCGTIDAYDPCGSVLFEAKTTSRLPSEVRSSHLLQVKLYAYLLERNGFDIKSISVVYFTFGEFNRFDLPAEPIPTSAEVSEAIMKTVDCIQRPQGQYLQDWACSYCSYYRYCQVGLNKLLHGRAPKVTPTVCPISDDDEIMTWEQLKARASVSVFKGQPAEYGLVI